MIHGRVADRLNADWESNW